MGGSTRSVDHLTTPDLNLNFHRNDDGTYSVTIPTNRSGNDSQYPMLQALMKDREGLQGAIENVLIADGVPYRIQPIKINASGEVNGKLGGGIEAGGGGKVKGVVDASGKLQGATEVGGKVGGGIEFQIELGRSGLSMERQQKLQDLLDRNVDAFCLQWAKDHPKGTSITLPNGDVLKVPEKVIDQYVQANDPQKKAEKLIEDVRDGLKKLNPFSDAGAGAAAGFADAGHRYHGMYRDTLTQLDPLSGKFDGRAAGDVAAALVAGAASAGFDPQKPITVAGGTREGTVFVIQGDPSSPASRSAMVDTANLQVPDAAQIARLQAPAAAEAPQLDAQRQGGPARA